MREKRSSGGREFNLDSARACFGVLQQERQEIKITRGRQIGTCDGLSWLPASLYSDSG